jgi:hypothetical protein
MADWGKKPHKHLGYIIERDLIYSDADDFEPETAQVADKMAALGIDTESAKKEAIENASVTGPKPVKSTAVRSNNIHGDLTEMQKREMQKKSDRDLALDLFGWCHPFYPLSILSIVYGLRHGTGKREDD